MYPRELPVEQAFRGLRRLEEALGLTWIERNLKAFEARRESWARRPYTVWSNPERHPLVPGLWHLREWRRHAYSAHRRSLPRETLFVAEHGRYAGMVISSVSAQERPALREYLGRRLRADSPGPILFEVRLAASLLLHGHRARWLSPVMEDSPDIEISHGTQGVAVECKCQGLGAGRKVPNELFRRLAGEVDRIDNVGKSEYGIVIEPIDRLEPSDIQPLVAALHRVLHDDHDLMTELTLRGRYEVTARRLCV